VAAVFYGGDYNPEQWPEEVWAEDLALMRQAGVNLVSLGVFAWSRLEPAEGTYTFDWLDRILDRLHAAGVRVALATPTASPPPWFSLAHPDALPVTREGTRLTHGSRDTYCVAAPAYRSACLRIAGVLGQRYREHPALALWHVHNEYGTACHCDHAAAAFRAWLRRRYPSLSALNDAWTTAFWSQHYSDWPQVLPPRATQYLPNPAQALDFRRFLSDEMLAAFGEQRAVLRALTPGTPVTTNFVFGAWVPVNHARWAGDVDLVAVDHYPSAADLGAEEETAFMADLARSWAGGRSWLLMEQAPNLIYSGGRMLAKEPGRMARHSLSHIARGSRGAMFFQWRAPRGGAEAWHSAMVPHAGPRTRVFEEVCALGALLPRLSDVDTAAVEARIAVLWDAECWWALGSPGLPSADLDYIEMVRAAHGALWRAGFTVDFAAPDADLSGYPLVVVPGLYLISDEAARSIAAYVRGGGRLVVSYLSGIADPYGRVRLGGYPGALREPLGIRVTELHPLPAGGTVRLSTGDAGARWSESVELHGATAVARYAGGVLDGLPAITRHGYGSGTALYVSTRLDDVAYGRLLIDEARAVGVAPVCPGAPAGVEVVRRRAGDTTWLFVLNHTEVAREIPARGVELTSGAHVRETVRVPAGGFAVVRADTP
jgi:beta-galactosidase